MHNVSRVGGIDMSFFFIFTIFLMGGYRGDRV